MQTSAITSGHLVVPFFHISTTALLSQWTITFFRGHWLPQVFTAEAMANNSFQTMSLFTWSGDQWAWIQCPDQYAPQPREPDASVNSDIAGEADQFVSRMYEVPFQVGRNASHQSKSRHASVQSRRWWCIRETVQLRSIRRRRNILPAGTTLQANDSFPTKESSWCFVHLFLFLRDCSKKRMSCLLLLWDTCSYIASINDNS